MGDILTAIGGGLSAVLSGGLTGVIGVIVQRHFDLQKLQLDKEMLQERNSHEVAMKKVDLEIMSAEWASRTKIAEVEAAATVEVEDSKAFAASFAAEPVRYSQDVKANNAQSWVFVWLDALRGAIRPVLTAAFFFLMMKIYVDAKDILRQVGFDSLPVEEAVKLVDRVINTILYLGTTCTLHYFGTRNKQKPPQII